MRRARLCLAMAITLSASSIAHADDKTGKAYAGPGIGDRSDAKGAVYLHGVAQCLVKEAPSSARNLLDARPGSSREASVFRNVTGRINVCFPKGLASLTLGYMEMRGFLAEGLYLKDNPNNPDYSLIVHNPVPWPEDWMAYSKQVNNILPIYMMQFGSCVAAADPQGVDSLIRTNVRSREEKAAIDKLMPTLGSCLDSGRTFKVDAAILRALTAQGLYRGANVWLNPAAAANESQKAKS